MAEPIRIVWTGGDLFTAKLEATVAAMRVQSTVAANQTALALIRQAKINATGPARTKPGMRPGEGPGVVSGRLRNSIGVVSRRTIGDVTEIVVAPTAIYSRRLELGFRGTDSRGRRYNQPPYPFFTPAYEFVMRYAAPKYFAEAWAAVLRA